jgi:hypothetical protein
MQSTIEKATLVVVLFLGVASPAAAQVYDPYTGSYIYPQAANPYIVAPQVYNTYTAGNMNAPVLNPYMQAGGYYGNPHFSGPRAGYDYDPLIGFNADGIGFYNPYTGTVARHYDTYNPYTGASREGATAYNHYTGNWYHAGGAYNNFTGGFRGGIVGGRR